MSQAKIDNQYIKSVCMKISQGKDLDRSFEIFYEHTKENLQTFVFYMLKKHSSDIIQETYYSFYQKLESGFVPEEPVTYLKSIARNLIYNEIRSRRYHESIEEINIADDRTPDNKELISLIKKATTQLDEKYREVFVLKEFQGFDHNQIAIICGITVSNSRKRLSRAYLKLNKILAPYIKEIKEYL